MVDKRLYLPKEWTQDKERCEEAGVPEEERSYHSQSELALGLLERAVGLGHLQAPWVTADDTYGKSPEFRDGVAALGLWYMLEVPSDTPVWPPLTLWFTPEALRQRRPPQPRPDPAQRQQVRERAQALPASAWQAFTVGEGAQGARTYLFAFERRRESREGEPRSGLPQKPGWKRSALLLYQRAF